MDQSPDQTTSLVSEIRRWRTAALIAADRAELIRTVIDGQDGRLVFCGPAWLDGAEDASLQIPEEAFGSVVVGVELTSIDDGASADRWRIYHGEARSAHWFAAKPMFVKQDDRFEDELDLRNPIAASEPALCKRFNADRSALTSLLRGSGDDTPTLVGVDAWGIDLRARFAIARREFPQECSDASKAEASIEAMIRDANA